MGEPIIKTSGLIKKYRGVSVLDSISITVNKGDVYGLIGKNGAGKTTFIRMISGLINKDGGEITLFSNNNFLKEIHRVGFIIERPFLYPDNTAHENLNIFCKLTGVLPKRIDEVLDIVGLDSVDKQKKVKSYSYGMKQRLSIATSLISLPELLVLDEPLNGLDPHGIPELRGLLTRLNREHGITILVSSHILEELAKISNRYGILNKGKLIGEYTNSDIMNEGRSSKFLVGNARSAKDILEDSFRGIRLELLNENEFLMFNSFDMLPQVNRKLMELGIDLVNVTTVETNLEDYFLKLIGEEDVQ
jgi:ABC-2 type transport system ATP-binding protein